MRKEYEFPNERVKNPYARKKKAVGMNLSPEVVEYFKRTGGRDWTLTKKPVDCICWTAREEKAKKMTMKWVA